VEQKTQTIFEMPLVIVRDVRRPKYKFLVVSNYGWCWNMASWLEDEGHEAVLCILDAACKSVADGFVKKVDSVEEVLKGDEQREWILVADNIGMGAMLDNYRRQGWRVWGGSRFADRLEKDRAYAMQVFERLGLPIPFTYTASSLQEVRRFLLQHADKRWVLKPHDNKVSVYVSEGVEDALEVVDWWEDIGLTNTEVDIQQFIEGRNVDVEFLYANGQFCLPPNYTVETKKFLVDDLGQTVGCMSSVVWVSWEGCRVLKEVLFPFAQGVRRTGFCGPISLNIMVEEGTERLFVLEATPRIGYNAYYALHHLRHPDLGWGDLIHACVTHNPDEEPLGLDFRSDVVAVALEVSIPPAPLEHPDKNFQYRVYQEIAGGVPLFYEEGKTYPAWVHLCDVRKEGGKVVCAGTNAIVMEIVAVAEEASAALKKCWETLKQLRVPNKQARVRDAVEDFERYYPKWVRSRIVAPYQPRDTGMVWERAKEASG